MLDRSDAHFLRWIANPSCFWWQLRCVACLLPAAVCCFPLVTAAQTEESPIKKKSEDPTFEVVSVEKRGTILRRSPDSIDISTDSGTFTANLKRTMIVDFEERRIDTPPPFIEFGWDERSVVLRPGQLVQVETEVQGKRSRGRIKELEIVSIFPKREPGMTVVNDLRTRGPETEIGPSVRKPDRYRILGRVSRVRGTTLVLEYPARSGRRGETDVFQARLSSDAVVKLRDVMFAEVGDQVFLRGESRKDETEARCWATYIQVSRRGKGSPDKSPPVVARLPGESKTDPVESADKPKEEFELRGKILKIN